MEEWAQRWGVHVNTARRTVAAGKKAGTLEVLKRKVKREQVDGDERLLPVYRIRRRDKGK